MGGDAFWRGGMRKAEFMDDSVAYEVVEGIATLRVDNPPVNALSPNVRSALFQLIERANNDDAIRGVIVTGTGRIFIAGADIKLFNMPRTGPSIGDLLAYVEGMKKPVVAAIQGTALGGGFEIALGCHARVALSGISVGFPETTLGLIPGAGGTQRFPRLVGPANALKLITSGSSVSAAEAMRLGAIDAIVDAPDHLEATARQMIEQLSRLSRLPRARDFPPLPPGNSTDIDAARAEFDAVAAGLSADASPSVRASIEMVGKVFDTDFDEALIAESTTFKELLSCPVAQARIHAFLAERAVRRVKGVDRNMPLDPIRTVAVIGTGTMGSGIAITLANGGYDVQMIDSNAEVLEKAKANIAKTYADQLSRGRIEPVAAEAAQARFSWYTDMADGVATVDLVIEAVYEDMPLKKKIFAELSELAPAHAVLASNTSYQNIDELAAQTDRPGKVVGMHYFSPANIMKLLEVVRGAETSPATLAAVMGVAARTGKLAVVVGVCYGFVGNRMLLQRTVQTQKLLLEGCSPHEIDSVLVDFGFRMGPCQMQDLAGLDVAWRSRKARGERMEPIDTIADAGRWGMKTGRGYYLYPEGSRTGVDDAELLPMVAAVAQRLGVAPRHVDADEVQRRLLFPLINEGFRIVEEGIVERPGDIDVVYLNGYGWPRDKGGPMHHAQTYGLSRLADDLDVLADRLSDEQLRPARLLRELADSGRTLSEI